MSDMDDEDGEGEDRGRDDHAPPASEKQLNFARSLQRRIGLSDDELGELVEEVTGETDLEQLTIRQASELIDELQTQARERGIDLDAQPKASEKQVGFILSLKRRAHLTDAEFTQLLEEKCGVSAAEDVGRRDASKLIDELKELADSAKGGGAAKGGAKKKTTKKKAASAPKSAPPPPPPPADDDYDDEVPF